MKRAMTLMVVMVVLLFSQLALAEIEFHFGEPTLFRVGDVQDQGLTDQPLAAAGLKIVPLQAYTHLTSNIDEMTWPFLSLDQEFYKTVSFVQYGSGDYSVIVTLTDVKTGQSIKSKSEFINHEEGEYWVTFGPSSFSGDPSKLPRVFKITFSFKVGSNVKSVSTKILLR